MTYGQAKARQIIEQSVRGEGAAKISPADLIPIALEKVVKAGLELPGFSTTKNPTEAARLDPYGHGGGARAFVHSTAGSPAWLRLPCSAGHPQLSGESGRGCCGD